MAEGHRPGVAAARMSPRVQPRPLPGESAGGNEVTLGILTLFTSLHLSLLLAWSLSGLVSALPVWLLRPGPAGGRCKALQSSWDKNPNSLMRLTKLTSPGLTDIWTPLRHTGPPPTPPLSFSAFLVLRAALLSLALFPAVSPLNSLHCRQSWPSFVHISGPSFALLPPVSPPLGPGAPHFSCTRGLSCCVFTARSLLRLPRQARP